MAQFQIALEVGGTTVTETLNFADERGVEFLDDLIALQYTDEVDDGAGGKRPRTREEVAQFYIGKIMDGAQGMAKQLEQKRLDAVKAEATDLGG